MNSRLAAGKRKSRCHKGIESLRGYIIWRRDGGELHNDCAFTEFALYRYSQAIIKPDRVLAQCFKKEIVQIVWSNVKIKFIYIKKKSAKKQYDRKISSRLKVKQVFILADAP